MTRLSNRKTKLAFTTDAEVRYRGKLRPVVIEVPTIPKLIDGKTVNVPNGFLGSVRLQGTRQRYEFSWHGLHDWAADLHARREREARKLARAAKRKAVKLG